jgi:phage replication-related protein YjqB (UPF0714/DUF867 family)
MLTKTSYSAQFKPDKDRFIPPPPHHREHCLANSNQIHMIGLNRGQQVRIERLTTNGTTLALYTIVDTHEEEPNDVYIDYKNADDLKDRLDFDLSDNIDYFTGNLNAQVTAVGLTVSQARCNSEFIEQMDDNGHHRGLIVIAPHGGDIEEYTDEQAEHVGKQLSSKCVSVWVCKGFKQGGNAFDRWHITSTDISEKSFPKLKTVFGRRFEYAVAFHGMKRESICIGGSEPDPDHPDCLKEEISLKEEIKCAIEKAVDGSGIVVSTGGAGCPPNFNGNNKYNIVNRLGIIGVQIEQSVKARKCYGIQIADAVANVIGPRIKA